MDFEIFPFPSVAFRFTNFSISALQIFPRFPSVSWLPWVGRRFPGLIFQGQRFLQVPVRLGIIRLETDRFLEFVDRHVRLALAEQDRGQIVVGLGIIRLEADCLLKFADGRIGLVLF